MTIDFYNYYDNKDKLDKNIGLPTSANCELYGNFSIKNPVIKVKNVLGNYVQINSTMFDNNYYFVVDKVYKDGYWYLYLYIDVFMSYNTGIKNSVVHCTRNENSYTPDIPDDFNTTSVRKTNIIYKFGNGVPYVKNKNFVLIWRG